MTHYQPIPMPQDSAEWEAALLALWLYLTPLALTLSAIILCWRATVLHRWNRRMSRATFGLVLSYAVLMDRIFLRNLGIVFSPTASQPEPQWALFYVLTTVYFVYALLLEHAVPATIHFWRWLRRDPRAPKPIGIDDERGENHAEPV